MPAPMNSQCTSSPTKSSSHSARCQSRHPRPDRRRGPGRGPACCGRPRNHARGARRCGPAAAAMIRSRQLVRPSLGAMQYCDDLNNVALHSIWYNVWCTWNHELACAADAARSAKGGRRGQAGHRCPNSLDDAARRGRAVRGNALANIFEAAKIAGGILQPPRRHRGCNSRSYRSSACSSDRALPASSSLIPAVISPICHSLIST